MSSRLHHFYAKDPRRPDRELSVYFRVLNSGLPPHGYGRDFDPGCGPDIEITSIQIVRAVSRSVANLTAVERAAVEDQICERFDFASAERADREQDAELTSFAW